MTTKKTVILWAIAVTAGLLVVTVYVILKDQLRPRAVSYGTSKVVEFQALTPEVCGGERLRYNVSILSVNENSVIKIVRSWAAMDVNGLPKNLMLESLTTTASGIVRDDFQYIGETSRVVPEFVNKYPGLYEYREAVENGANSIYYVKFTVPEYCKERVTN